MVDASTANYGATGNVICGGCTEALHGRSAPEKDRRFTLAFVRIITCISALAEGYDISLINTILPRLKDAFFPNTWQVACFVSSFHLFMGCGALCGSSVADVLGRRLALVFVNALLVVGAAGMIVAVDFWTVLAARALQGTAVGFGFVCVGLYLAEVVPAHSRGFFVTLETVFLNVGMALASVVVYLLSFTIYVHNWRLAVALAALPPSICVTMVWKLPESPRWLRLAGREAEARNSMQLVCDDAEVAETFKFNVEPTARWTDVLCPHTTSLRRAMLIGMGLAMYQMLGGVAVLLQYSTTILGREFSHRDAVLGSSIMVGAKLAAACTAAGIVDEIGRRRMLLGSTTAMAVSFGSLALAFFFSAGYWIKVALFACITMSFTFGLGTAAYAVLVEVFASPYRAKATALAFAVSRWSSSLTTAVFPMADESFGTTACWLYFCVVNATAWLFVYTFVPETGGYKLEEIEDAIASHANSFETTTGSGEAKRSL